MYRGKTLTCWIELHMEFVKWECNIDGKPGVAGVNSLLGEKDLPSSVLSEAIHVGRSVIDRSLIELDKARGIDATPEEHELLRKFGVISTAERPPVAVPSDDDRQKGPIAVLPAPLSAQPPPEGEGDDEPPTSAR